MAKPLTKKEFSLWTKIQMENLERELKTNSDTPISKLSNQAQKQFLSQKWICNVDPGKFPFEIEKYQEFNDIDGPDLTRIPRSRYDFLSHSSKTDKGPKQINSYALYVKEQMKLLNDVPQNEKMTVISQKWKNLSESKKEEYKLKAQQLNESNNNVFTDM